jgi:hypothetical protein
MLSDPNPVLYRKLRRRPDATLDQSAVLRFEYATNEATPEVPPPEDITPEE